MEALGQHVHQEAPDKLVRGKPHRLPAARAVDAIVLPTERDAGVVGCNEAAVRDGDTMRVTGEIAQHLLGSRERRLAVDYPVDASQPPPTDPRATTRIRHQAVREGYCSFVA